LPVTCLSKIVTFSLPVTLLSRAGELSEFADVGDEQVDGTQVTARDKIWY
jgi:hypothetical protein